MPKKIFLILHCDERAGEHGIRAFESAELRDVAFSQLGKWARFTGYDCLEVPIESKLTGTVNKETPEDTEGR